MRTIWLAMASLLTAPLVLNDSDNIAVFAEFAAILIIEKASTGAKETRNRYRIHQLLSHHRLAVRRATPPTLTGVKGRPTMASAVETKLSAPPLRLSYSKQLWIYLPKTEHTPMLR